MIETITSIGISIMASIWFAYIWKRTKEPIILMGSFVFYLGLIFKFIIGYDAYDIAFIVLLWGYLAVFIYMLIRDKCYELVALVIASFVILATVRYGMNIVFIGQNAIVVSVILYAWYMRMRQLKCFNPFHCDIKTLKYI